MGPATGFYLWAVLFELRREVASASPPVAVPGRVPALAGSCALIPCSFRPAKGRQYQLKLRYESSVFRLRGTAFSSHEPFQVHWDYQGRAQLAGDLQRGDCSLRMDGVTVDDRRKYEVWLKDLGTPEWLKSSKVLLDVSDAPETPLITGPGAVIEGQLVTLNCTVSSPCPSRPPQVVWRWDRGVQESGTVTRSSGVPLPQGQGQMLSSSLNFVASSLSQPKVRCEARYPGGRTASVAKEMHVRFPPRDVTVHVHSLSVQEGASVLLSCSCKSDPPASEFQWWLSEGGRRAGLPQRTHTVRLHNVSRGLRVGCGARNPIGQAESRPYAINVQYKPAISPQSLCRWDEGTVSCYCAVDANPRPAVTWSVNGSSPPDGYNSSVSVENGTLWATLSGDLGQLLSVACYAYNALGNDSSALLYASDDSLMWKVIPAVCVLSCLSLLFLLLLILHCYRRKTGKHVLNSRTSSSVYPGNLGIYQETMPLYINCTEVTHIYTNGSYQLVYQNCTPLFVRNKQVLQVHQRERRIAWTDRPTQRERQRPEADTEMPVYLEII